MRADRMIGAGTGRGPRVQGLDIAVIGTAISCLSAAWLLCVHHRVPASSVFCVRQRSSSCVGMSTSTLGTVLLRPDMGCASRVAMGPGSATRGRNGKPVLSVPG